MYVMIDWHSIGNMTTGVFQDPMYDTTKEETYGFWRAMSRHYAATTRWRSSSSSTTTGGVRQGLLGRWKTIVEMRSPSSAPTRSR
jgi:hypothetical protein